MTTSTVQPVNQRSTTLLKYAFMIVAYSITLSIICGTVVNLLVDKLHAQVPRADFTLPELLQPLVAPGTIAIAVAAWLMRRRWLDLRAAQLLVPAVGMAILTPLVFLLVLAGAQSVFHFEQFSMTAWAVTWRILITISAVLVVQLLRLRRKTSTLSYV